MLTHAGVEAQGWSLAVQRLLAAARSVTLLWSFLLWSFLLSQTTLPTTLVCTTEAQPPNCVCEQARSSHSLHWTLE